MRKKDIEIEQKIKQKLRKLFNNHVSDFQHAEKRWPNSIGKKYTGYGRFIVC